MELKTSWFKPRAYGMGWKPASKEGWVVTIAFFTILFWDFVRIDQASHSVSDTFIAFAPDFVALSILFHLICWLTGEPIKFMWKGKNIFEHKEKDVD